MKKIKVLVIDSNEDVISSIKTFFEDNNKYEIINYIKNGEEALDYIVNNEKEYDVIIMDCILPGLDGFYIMDALKSKKLLKKIILTSNCINEIIINKIKNYNLGYFIQKPYSLSYLADTIYKIHNLEQNPQGLTGTMMVEISDLLHNLGVPSHLKGYGYLREGIYSICREDTSSFYITKDVYPKIAEKYATTSSRVERAIRHAIEVSWNRGELILMEDIFGYSVDYERSKPTNSEYIMTLADRIKLKMF